ncbi:ATP-binding cassette domain-containing protein [Chloroflexi bacterium TSY]|nr:ATP-binding cassette domain-containing protein [Chloroflexi bacterium TSY]
MTTKSILTVEHLRKFFPVKRGILRRTVGHVKAVDDVSFAVEKGECFGLVGESGCGKTTLSRCILRLIEPDSGRILLHTQEEEIDVLAADKQEMSHLRRSAQIIFQDPFSSLDPRWRVKEIITEPLVAQGMNRRTAAQRALEILPIVGLNMHFADRYPHELSGGERQRVGIARALIVQPALVLADEPVSALDVSVQAQIINLLLELQTQMDLSYVFVAHDLSMIKHVSDRIGVMYLGQMVEIGSRAQIFEAPTHPYTYALLASVPIPDPETRGQGFMLEGEIPSPTNPPSACRFSTRCSYAQERCHEEAPELRTIRRGHQVRCHFAGELDFSGI